MEHHEQITVNIPSVIGGKWPEVDVVRATVPDKIVMHDAKPQEIRLILDLGHLLSNYDGKCQMIVPTREKHENQEAQKPE